MAQEVMNQLEAELGRQVNPLEGLLRIGSDLTQPVAIRVQCMAESLPYLYPKLQSQALAVTTREDNGLDLACIEMERAMAAPGGVEIIQRAALLMAAQDAPLDSAPARILPPGDTYQDR